MNIIFKDCHSVKYFPTTSLIWDIELEGVDFNNYTTEILRNDIWTVKGNVNGRFECNNDSTILTELRDEIRNLKSQVLADVYNYDKAIFKERWPAASLDFYQNNTAMTSSLIKDPPNLRMKGHLDHGSIIVQMIINLVDNPQGTDFYNPNTQIAPGRDSGQLIYTSSGKQGKGVLFFNNSAAIHGMHTGDRDRYTLSSNILMWPQQYAAANRG